MLLKKRSFEHFIFDLKPCNVFECLISGGIELYIVFPLMSDGPQISPTSNKCHTNDAQIRIRASL